MTVKTKFIAKHSIPISLTVSGCVIKVTRMQYINTFFNIFSNLPPQHRALLHG